MNSKCYMTIDQYNDLQCYLLCTLFRREHCNTAEFVYLQFLVTQYNLVFLPNFDSLY